MKKTEDCFLKVKKDYLRFLSKEKIFDQSTESKMNQNKNIKTRFRYVVDNYYYHMKIMLKNLN